MYGNLFPRSLTSKIRKIDDVIDVLGGELWAYLIQVTIVANQQAEISLGHENKKSGELTGS